MPVPAAPAAEAAGPMALTEFDIIRRWFTPARTRGGVRTGVGDDGAVLAPPPARELVVVTDTLVEGVHFLPGADPADLGHRLLAVNLSDLAAMGAEPAWFTLNLTVPDAEAVWFEGFAAGLGALAERWDMALVGGDTCRGPCVLSLTAAGTVPPGQALLRGGGRAGDAVYVTGTLGDAAAGLACLRGDRGGDACEALVQRFLRPEPRVAAGLALRGLASACIDVSDGLAADLGHLLAASGCGAVVEVEAVPVSPELERHEPDPERRLALALGGGDDYELCFCVPPRAEDGLAAAAEAAGVGFTRIGELVREPGLVLRHADGRPCPLPAGWTHFGEAAE